LAFASGTCGIGLGLERAALTIFLHHSQTQSPRTTAKVKLKDCLGQ